MLSKQATGDVHPSVVRGVRRMDQDRVFRRAANVLAVGGVGAGSVTQQNQLVAKRPPGFLHLGLEGGGSPEGLAGFVRFTQRREGYAELKVHRGGVRLRSGQRRKHGARSGCIARPPPAAPRISLACGVLGAISESPALDVRRARGCHQAPQTLDRAPRSTLGSDDRLPTSIRFVTYSACGEGKPERGDPRPSLAPSGVSG